MKLLLVLLALCAPAQAQVLKQNGGIPSTITTPVAITGTSATCFSVDNPTLVVDCAQNLVTIGGSGGGKVSSGPFVNDGYGGGATIGFSSAAFANDIALTLARAAGPTTSGARGISMVFKDANNPSLIGGVNAIRTAPDGHFGSNLVLYVHTNAAGAATGISGLVPALSIDNIGNTAFYVRTKAQIDAMTPEIIGGAVICSNCTVPYDVCVATAQTLSGYRATINSAINTEIPGTLVGKGCGTNN